MKMVVTKHALYSTWTGMKSRCYNPKSGSYARYGGRGIKICERWMSFHNFIEDMGERPEGHSIDRINNDGDYEPTNCKWSNVKQQLNNTSRNISFKIDNKVMTVAEWADKSGLPYSVVWNRYYKGFNLGDIISAPKNTRVNPDSYKREAMLSAQDKKSHMISFRVTASERASIMEVTGTLDWLRKYALQRAKKAKGASA